MEFLRHSHPCNVCGGFFFSGPRETTPWPGLCGNCLATYRTVERLYGNHTAWHNRRCSVGTQTPQWGTSGGMEKPYDFLPINAPDLCYRLLRRFLGSRDTGAASAVSLAHVEFRGF